MEELKIRRLKVLSTLYDELETVDIGSEDYDRIQAEILKIEAMLNDEQKVEVERVKVENDRKHSKWKLVGEVLVGTALTVGGQILVMSIGNRQKRNLAIDIGKVEQHETFVSTPGRGMSSWFK